MIEKYNGRVLMKEMGLRSITTFEGGFSKFMETVKERFGEEETGRAEKSWVRAMNRRVNLGQLDEMTKGFKAGVNWGINATEVRIINMSCLESEEIVVNDTTVNLITGTVFDNLGTNFDVGETLTRVITEKVSVLFGSISDFFKDKWDKLILDNRPKNYFIECEIMRSLGDEGLDKFRSLNFFQKRLFVKNQLKLT